MIMTLTARAPGDIDATIAKHGLTLAARFVPFSQSRNKAEKHPSLNWEVTLVKEYPANGHGWPAHTSTILVTDYSAKSGHCPAYKASVRNLGSRDSVMRDSAIRWECEHGFDAVMMEGYSHIRQRKTKLQPNLKDVLHSLLMDYDAIDYQFTDWCDNL